MPKGRYEIMRNYMPKVGSLGHDMMFRTCTVQVNLDFSSEADMINKFRAGLSLQPIATALFANSPFTEGKPNGYLSMRRETFYLKTKFLVMIFEPQVPKSGLNTPFRDGLLKHVAQDVLHLAKGGLERRGYKETGFLNAVAEVVNTGADASRELLEL
nr:glutamate--cysteine ligase, chloroplastic isoform X2 [Ipomoea batatas]